MKSLIIFDSTFGNTKIIAQTIAEELGKEVKMVFVSDFKEKDLEGIDLVVVGSPIIGWRPSPNMGTFLSRLDTETLKGVKAAAFDTRVKVWFSGDAGKKIASSLEKAGAKIITEPKPFFVEGKEGPLLEGEVEKAKEWAKTIKDVA
jgi:flavodoxin